MKRAYSFVDLTGRKFGRLTVLEEAGRNKWGSVLWKCFCDCGNKIIASTSNLNGGNTKSCGCYKSERTSERRKFDLLGRRFGRLNEIITAGVVPEVYFSE